MKCLITGGSSYLGQHLVPLVAATLPTVYTYFANDPLNLPFGRQLDLRDGVAVAALLQKEQPDVIIHMAGSNRGADVVAVIERGAHHIVAAAQQLGARLIHLSTDVVFDGTAGPYRETDPVTPVHAYGLAKVNAEQIVSAHANHVIVRTSLIYGLAQMDRGTEGFVRALQAGKTLTLFSDQLRSPVWVDSLCEAIVELIPHSYRGVLHLAGSQAVSRADFGLKLLDYWDVAERETLQVGEDVTGRFPRDCRLDNQLARTLLKQTNLPGVDAVLQQYSR